MNKKSYMKIEWKHETNTVNCAKLTAIVINCLAVAINSTQLSKIVVNCHKLCCRSC